MKKTILILSAVALTFASCKKEEITKTNTNTTTTAPDCDCNEVVEIGPTFNLPDGNQFGSYVTINQCTGVQINRDWNTVDNIPKPNLGDCKY
tara:strand:- start:644 stop:919 length:276 start_codon:yes stop_codon:yes gene_type:complete